MFWKKVRRRQKLKQVNVNRGDRITFTQRFKVCERWKQYFECLPNLKKKRRERCDISQACIRLKAYERAV